MHADPRMQRVKMCIGSVFEDSTTRSSTALSMIGRKAAAMRQFGSCPTSRRAGSLFPGVTGFITTISEPVMPASSMVLSPSASALEMSKRSTCRSLLRKTFFIIRFGDRTASPLTPANRKSFQTNPRETPFATTPFSRAREGSVCERGSIAPSRETLSLVPATIQETAFSSVRPTRSSGGFGLSEKIILSATTMSRM